MRTYTITCAALALLLPAAACAQQPEARPSTARPGVSVLDTAFAMPQLERTRRVWVYLPPDYATSDRRYPVLYMHDGQNLFDAATAYAGEWGIDETLDSLHTAGDPGIIVVGIDNGRERRLDEYSPWRNERHGGGEGAAYAEWLVHTLKPFIDQRYRTLADRSNTAIAGSSMGGLISLYALLQFPEVYGRAGIFSPAFWFAPEIFDAVRASRAPYPDTRVYMVSGGRELQQGERAGVYRDDQARMQEALIAAGFRAGQQVKASVIPDGEHSEWFWRREFPAAYRWLFAPQSQ